MSVPLVGSIVGGPQFPERPLLISGPLRCICHLAGIEHFQIGQSPHSGLEKKVVLTELLVPCLPLEPSLNNHLVIWRKVERPSGVEMADVAFSRVGVIKQKASFDNVDVTTDPPVNEVVRSPFEHDLTTRPCKQAGVGERSEVP